MPNTESKKRMGFRTSAFELQDKFEEIFKKTKDKKQAWEDMSESVSGLVKLYKEARKTKGDDDWDRFVTNFGSSILIERLITIMGIQISDIEERLVTCEQSIEKLHLKVK